MPTKISWADEVWSPTIGCTRVSSGCDHCYAYALHDQRHLAWKRGRWPQAPAQYHQPFSKVQLLSDRLDQPLRWRKPRRIFVDSMSALFHEEVPDEFLDRVFATMMLTPRHTFQVLTKRPDRMCGYLADEARPVYWHGKGRSPRDASTASKVLWAAQSMSEASVYCDYPFGDEQDWPLPNVWLGVSVEDQATADERIPLLLETPAAVRFVSVEPMLGPVDLVDPTHSANPGLSFQLGGKAHMGEWDWLSHEFAARDDPEDTDLHGAPFCVTCGNREGNPMHPSEHYPALDWVIVGGESGTHHRAMNEDWVRSIRAQCRAAGVAFFGKQRSGPRPGIALPGDLGDREFPREEARDA